jgi:hypothetical protein
MTLGLLLLILTALLVVGVLPRWGQTRTGAAVGLVVVVMFFAWMLWGLEP